MTGASMAPVGETTLMPAPGDGGSSLELLASSASASYPVASLLDGASLLRAAVASKTLLAHFKACWTTLSVPAGVKPRSLVRRTVAAHVRKQLHRAGLLLQRDVLLPPRLLGRGVREALLPPRLLGPRPVRQRRVRLRGQPAAARLRHRLVPSRLLEERVLPQRHVLLRALAPR